MSSGGAETGAKYIQTVVGTVRGGCGTDKGGGGDIRDIDGDKLNLLEDNVANITLGTEPNAHLPILQDYNTANRL